MLGIVLAEDEEQATITGMVQIIDFAGMNSNHMLHMTPAFVKKAMIVWQVRKNQHRKQSCPS